MGRLRASLPAPRELTTWALASFLAWVALQSVAPDQVDLFLAWAQRIAAGQDPYGTPAGYPPLAMFAMTVPEPFVGGSVGAYRLWFAAGVLIASLGGLAVASHAERRLGRPGIAFAYVVGVAAMGSNLLLSRYDLLPAVLTLAALAAAARGRSGWAWAALGLSVALKPYGLVLVPLLGLWELRRSVPAPVGLRLARAAGWIVVPSVVAVLAMAPIAGLADATQAYGFQLQRAATQDSTPGVVVAALAPLGLEQRPSFDVSCGCRVREGEAMGAVRAAGTVLVLVGLAVLCVVLWRRRDAQTLLVAANAALALLLLGSAVYSPQYLVWLAAPVCLLAGRRAGWVAIGATAVATGAAALSYQLHYGDVILFRGTGRDLVVLRVLAQVVALGALVHLLRRPDREAVRGDVAVGSAPS